MDLEYNHRVSDSTEKALVDVKITQVKKNPLLDLQYNHRLSDSSQNHWWMLKLSK